MFIYSTLACMWMDHQIDFWSILLKNEHSKFSLLTMSNTFSGITLKCWGQGSNIYVTILAIWNITKTGHQSNVDGLAQSGTQTGNLYSRGIPNATVIWLWLQHQLWPQMHRQYCCFNKPFNFCFYVTWKLKN